MGETTIGKQIEGSPERRAFEIRRRMDNLLKSLFKEQWEQGQETKDPKGYVMAYVKKAMGELIPEAVQEINPAFDILYKQKIIDDEQFLGAVADVTINLMAKHLSLEELETRLKNRPKNITKEQLSRALNCEIQGSSVVLHVDLVFFQDHNEAIASLIEGLQTLAKKIKKEEKYKDITEIIGYSDLVKQKHRLFSKYGFTVTKDNKGKPTDEAKISKEKLLELFGNN